MGTYMTGPFQTGTGLDNTGTDTGTVVLSQTGLVGFDPQLVKRRHGTAQVTYCRAELNQVLEEVLQLIVLKYRLRFQLARLEIRCELH